MSVLDQEIMNFGGNSWTARDAATGLICFGMTGSGKSSGPLRSIALKFLQYGYGGIVLCAKPDECGTWLDYAGETGRNKDIVLLSRETFCFLDYEFSRPAESGGGQVENVVNIFLEVVKITKDKKSGGTSDEYWQNAIKQFLRNTISLLVMAHEAVTLPNIKKVIDSSPRDNSIAEKLKIFLLDFHDFCYASWERVEARKNGSPEDFKVLLAEYETELKKNSARSGEGSRSVISAAHEYCIMLLLRAVYFGNDDSPDYNLAYNYFLVEFPQLDDRTRSNTISSFTVLADSMLRGEFLRCFGADKS